MPTNFLQATSQSGFAGQVAMVAGASFLITFLLTPIVRWAALCWGIVDKPDGQRKLQQQPVALLGGVAVLAGLSITVFMLAASGALHGSLESVVLVSMGLFLLFTVGLIDDAYNLRAGWKLIAQLAASAPIVLAGCAFESVSLCGFQIWVGPLGILAALAWLVVCTNAVNLIDGHDGLCSTVGMWIAAGVVAVAAIKGADHTMLCALALCGSLLGFLCFNRPPASIYLGDAGSMVIGMTLALLTLHVSMDEGGVVNPLVMISLMAVPLGDVALAVVRRKLAGQPIFQPDRGHIHHRLMGIGFKPVAVLLTISALAVGTSSIAVASIYAGSDLLAAAALVSTFAVLVNRRLIGHLEWQQALISWFGDPAVGREPTTEHGPILLNFEQMSVTLKSANAAEAGDDSDAERRRAA